MKKTLKYLTLPIAVSLSLLLIGCDSSSPTKDQPNIEQPAPDNPEDPNAGNPEDPNAGDPEDPNAGDPEDPNAGDPEDPNAGNPPTPPTYTALETTVVRSTTGESITVDRTANGFVFRGHEGKIVLLEVYGDTCPHCVDAIPSYNAVKARYPENVLVIALETYGTLHYASQQQYTVIPRANVGNMLNFVRTLTGYNLQAVPYLMVLDRSGKIVYDKILADFPATEIDNLIQSLL